MSGLPIVLSGPSGSGKTTLSRLVLDSLDNIRESVSYTTRPARRGEEDGVHYHFIDDCEFKNIDGSGGFLESSAVHGFYYGTGAEWVSSELQRGTDILFVLDIAGGEALKSRIDAVTIFIVPPGIHSLEERLVRRGTDSAEIIQRRMSTARAEIEAGVKTYDYVVQNTKVETALNDILSVIRTEHIKRASREEILERLIGR